MVLSVSLSLSLLLFPLWPVSDLVVNSLEAREVSRSAAAPKRSASGLGTGPVELPCTYSVRI